MKYTRLYTSTNDEWVVFIHWNRIYTSIYISRSWRIVEDSAAMMIDECAGLVLLCLVLEAHIQNLCVPIWALA